MYRLQHLIKLQVAEINVALFPSLSVLKQPYKSMTLPAKFTILPIDAFEIHEAWIFGFQPY